MFENFSQKEGAMKARIAVVMMFFAIVAMAAVPQIIQYQGKLTDMSGVGENDTLDIRFRVFDVETGGDSLWAMTIANVPVVHGMFDVNIGPIDLPFDEQYWLEIVVDGEVLAPRVQLTSSPYAFRAAVADSFTGGIPPVSQDTMIAHWDSLRGIPSDIADGDQIIETRDTMVAHWDSIRGIPDLNDGDWIISGSNMYSGVTGNVGIGTTSPNSKLSFSSAFGDNFDEWSDYKILLFPSPTPQESYGIGIKANTLAFNSNRDYDFDKHGVTMMTIQDGNVGIGIENPGQKLEVNGSVLIPTGGSYRIGSSSDSGNRLRLHQLGTNAYIDWGEQSLFFRSGVSGVTDKVVFTGDGKVGIGTSYPSFPLQVNHTVAAHSASDSPTMYAMVSDGVDSMVAILAGYYGTDGVVGITSKPYGSGVSGKSFADRANGVFGYSLVRGGEMAYSVYGFSEGWEGAYNVGVLGSARGSEWSYGVYCSGDGLYTGTWSHTSDRKFKRNIEPMNGILGRIMELNPVTFEMRLDEFDYMGFSEGTKYGLIAQELQTVFPELVKSAAHPIEEGRDQIIEFQSVEYIPLTAILIKAVQEQQALIEAQQEQIKTQAEEMNEFRRRIEALEKNR